PRSLPAWSRSTSAAGRGGTCTSRRPPRSASARSPSYARRSVSDLRVGLGLDAHALVDGVRLVLGGVELDHPRGLAGHSDGDVIAHALIDAILGAANLGDIGTLFPSGDERFRGASSLDLLEEAYARVREAGYELVNADCVLIGEEPRLTPHRDAMRARLAERLDVAPE